MARAVATKVYANFSNGLITEASPLSHPDGSASDIDNLDLIEDGSVQRRSGLKFDASTVIPFPVGSRPLAATATNIFKWRAVNGDPDLNIGVVQVGDELHFYYLKDDLISFTTVAAATITLSDTVRTSDSTQLLRYAADIQVSSGGGRLYVVGKYIDPFVLTFNEPVVEFTTGTLTETALNLKIRDFEIFKEGETVEISSLSGEARQDYMSGAHFYNLANQGWPITVDTFSVVDSIVVEDTAACSSATNPDSGTTTTEPAVYTNTNIGFFPTTSDTFHSYQAGGGATITEQIAFSPWLLENDYTGNTPSPRGRFIKEAFYVRRAATGNIGTITPTSALTAALTVDETTTSNVRPEAVAFYAGRVWYAGLQGGQYTNNVYFSQVIGDDLKKASKCYQESDPTAEVINELVATDGGLFNLEEVGKIHRIEPIGSSLAIVADNGVWVIAGEGEFSSFSATSFSIRKVTDQGAINSASIVFARDAMYYWGETALYTLQLDQSGALVAADITSSTIKRFFQQTTAFSKKSSFSVFDEGANKIIWFYSDTSDSSFDNYPNKAFNKALYYDISLNAFGKYSLGITSSILPVSAINSSILTQLQIEDIVTDGGVAVTADGEDVVVDIDIFVPDRSSVKIMTITGDEVGGWSYRFSDFTDIDDFTDWDTDYTAFIEGGFDSLGDIISKAKKASILQTHFTRTETGFKVNPDDPLGEELILTNQSGCLVSYKWDWGEAPLGNQFQAYKLLKNYTPADVTDNFDYDRSVISTRNRLRGRGTSIGLRFESEPGKDMKLLGYGIVFSNRGRV